MGAIKYFVIFYIILSQVHTIKKLLKQKLLNNDSNSDLEVETNKIQVITNKSIEVPAI